MPIVKCFSWAFYSTYMFYDLIFLKWPYSFRFFIPILTQNFFIFTHSELHNYIVKPILLNDNGEYTIEGNDLILNCSLEENDMFRQISFRWFKYNNPNEMFSNIFVARERWEFIKIERFTYDTLSSHLKKLNKNVRVYFQGLLIIIITTFVDWR